MRNLKYEENDIIIDLISKLDKKVINMLYDAFSPKDIEIYEEHLERLIAKLKQVWNYIEDKEKKHASTYNTGKEKETFFNILKILYGLGLEDKGIINREIFNKPFIFSNYEQDRLATLSEDLLRSIHKTRTANISEKAARRYSISEAEEVQHPFSNFKYEASCKSYEGQSQLKLGGFGLSSKFSSELLFDSSSESSCESQSESLDLDSDSDSDFSYETGSIVINSSLRP